MNAYKTIRLNDSEVRLSYENESNMAIDKHGNFFIIYSLKSDHLKFVRNENIMMSID